jgi:hypothetical protein
MKLPPKILLNLAVVLTGVLSGCSTMANGSEWLPSMDIPVVLEPAVLDSIPIPDIKSASHIWIRSLDLDNDGKADSVVTVAFPPELGPYWRNYRWVTYVFRGTHKGAFLSYGAHEATLWFSIVTREAQDHVRSGDTETRTRQFWQAQHLVKTYSSNAEPNQGWLIAPPGLEQLVSVPLAEPTRLERLQAETELFGFAVSGHPLELFPDVAWDSHCPVNRLSELSVKPSRPAVWSLSSARIIRSPVSP